ncbi:hypothetical protein VNO80_24001 [Phaseolus coccineus]|uniref:Uncharacterized protein n=1 Tax=Phaseolus coccineus TaxID=3886 RepID=A0AAN9LWI3_PHACN
MPTVTDDYHSFPESDNTLAHVVPTYVAGPASNVATSTSSHVHVSPRAFPRPRVSTYFNPRAVFGVTRCGFRVWEWRARAVARRGMEWEFSGGVFYWWCFRIQHNRSEGEYYRSFVFVSESTNKALPSLLSLYYSTRNCILKIHDQSNFFLPVVGARFLGARQLMDCYPKSSDKNTLKRWFFIDKRVG